MILLRGNHRRPQHISLPLTFEERERSHELRRFEDDFAIPGERAAIGMRSITQFRVKDRMRLLPNQQRANGRGTVSPFRSNHLGPAGAPVSLSAGTFSRAVKYLSVPVKTSFQQRQSIPKREMRCVPPMHLQMKLAVPAIDRETGLLRRRRARALNGRQVLRKDYPPLELLGSGVATIRKIDGASGAPKSLPM